MRITPSEFMMTDVDTYEGVLKQYGLNSTDYPNLTAKDWIVVTEYDVNSTQCTNLSEKDWIVIDKSKTLLRIYAPTEKKEIYRQFVLVVDLNYPKEKLFCAYTGLNRSRKITIYKQTDKEKIEKIKRVLADSKKDFKNFLDLLDVVLIISKL